MLSLPVAKLSGLPFTYHTAGDWPLRCRQLQLLIMMRLRSRIIPPVLHVVAVAEITFSKICNCHSDMLLLSYCSPVDLL